MGRRHRRRYYRTHQSVRSWALGGIDADVARIFLSLPSRKLEIVLSEYGNRHGKSAQYYAKAAYDKWRIGTVRMSGMVAERLLDMVPIILEPQEQFELIMKLRRQHQKKVHRCLSCTPSTWRETIGPVINEMVKASSHFELPRYVVDRATWLTSGDSLAAQKLLAAAEKEEAKIRCQHLAEEYKQIEHMLENLPGRGTFNHTIQLPQGTVAVTIALPRSTFIQWLRKAFA